MPTTARTRHWTELAIGIPVLILGFGVCCIGAVFALISFLPALLPCGDSSVCSIPNYSLVPIGMALYCPVPWIVEGVGVGLFARRLQTRGRNGLLPGALCVALTVASVAAGYACLAVTLPNYLL